MGRLSAFTFATLNGYIEGVKGDISWHRHGEEKTAYAARGLASGSVLLFGRITYQMMASYWPTPMAAQQDPVVAAGMNAAEKIVFSRTLQRADWTNTRVLKGPIGHDVRLLKSGARDMTLLGSGSILSQLSDEGLIDEYQIMLDPVAIGAGTTMFGSLKRTMNLALTDVQRFGSGVVLLNYVPRPE